MAFVQSGLTRGERDNAVQLTFPFTRFDQIGTPNARSDVYRVVLPQDGTYTFQLSAANGSNLITTGFDVYNEFGSPFRSSNGPDRSADVTHDAVRGEFTVRLSGEVGEVLFIKVAPSLFETTDYRLTGTLTGADGNDNPANLPISPFSSTIGTVVGGGDFRDIFKFQAPENGTITYRINGNVNSQVFRDVNLFQAVTTSATQTGSSFQATAGENYYLRITGGQTGPATPYTVQATFEPPPPDNNDTFETARVIGTGTTFDRVGPKDAVDYLRINTTTVGRYVFRVAGSNGPIATVYDENRNVLSRFATHISGAEVILDISPGRNYFIGIEADKGKESNYSVTGSFVPLDNNETFETATLITGLPTFSPSTFIFPAISNTVGGYDPLDYFRFVPTQSGDFRMFVSGASGNLDLRLYDANRNLIAEGTSPSAYEFISAAVIAGQTYFVGVMPSSDTVNTFYSLRGGFLADTNNSPETALPLSINTPIASSVGDITRDEVDFYTFRATRTGIAQLNLSTFAVSFSILDAQLNVVTTTDRFAVNEADLYYIKINPRSITTSSQYAISASISGDIVADGNDNFDTASLQQTGTRLIDRFVGGPDSKDVYKFTATRNGVISVDVGDLKAPVELAVYDAERNLIMRSRKSDSIDFYAIAGRSYYATVEAIGQGQTFYDLYLSTISRVNLLEGENDVPGQTLPTGTARPTLSIGQTFTGNLSSITDSDWFNIVVPEGESVVVRLEGAEGGTGPVTDPDLVLRKFDGQIIKEEIGNPDQPAVLRVSGTGSTQVIEIVSKSGSIGTYRIVVESDPTPVAPTAEGTATLSVLASESSAETQDSLEVANNPLIREATTEADDTTTNLVISGLPFSTTGSVGGSDPQDIFRFATTSAGTITFNVNGTGNFLIATDSSLTSFGSGSALNFNGSGISTVQFATDPGKTYFLRIAAPDSTSISYTASTSFTPLPVDTNVSFDSAITYDVNSFSNDDVFYGANTGTGYIGGGNPSDYYRIAPEKTGTLRFQIQPVDVPTTATIYDSARNIIHQFPSSRSTEGTSLAVVAGEVYYLQYQSSSTSQGKYDFSVALRPSDNNDSFDTATRLTSSTIQKAAGGFIENAGRADFFSFTAEKSGEYRMLLFAALNQNSGLNLSAVDVRLYDENRNLLAQTTGSGFSKFTTAEVVEGRRYFVNVTSVGKASLDSYRLSAGFASDFDNSAATGTLLTPGQTYTSNIGTRATDSSDYFTFRASATGLMSLRLSNTTPIVTDVPRYGYNFLVMDAKQQVVAGGRNSDSFHNFTFGVTEGQTYHVLVANHFDHGSSTYNLSAQLEAQSLTDDDNTFATALQLETNTILYDRFVGGVDRRDYVAITPTESGLLTIAIENANGDVDLNIYDLNQNLITRSRRAKAGGSFDSNDSVTFMAGAGLKYYAVVEMVGDGSTTYTLNVSGTNTTVQTAETNDIAGFGQQGATRPTLAPGMAFTASLNSATDSDQFTLPLVTGQRFVLRVDGSAAGAGTLTDPDIRIRNHLGAVISQVTGKPNESAQALVSTEGFGDVSVEIFSASGATGTYRLILLPDTSGDYSSGADIPGAANVSFGSPSAGSLSAVRLDAGASITSRIDSATDTDWVRFTMRDSERFNITLQGQGNGTPSFSMVLRDRSGTQISQTDAVNGTATVNLSTAGDYWLEIRSLAGSTGAYNISASAIAAPANTTSTIQSMPQQILSPPDPMVLSQLSAAIQAGQPPNLFEDAVSPQSDFTMFGKISTPLNTLFMAN